MFFICYYNKVFLELLSCKFHVIVFYFHVLFFELKFKQNGFQVPQKSLCFCRFSYYDNFKFPSFLQIFKFLNFFVFVNGNINI